MNAAEKLMYVFVKIVLFVQEAALKIYTKLKLDKAWKKFRYLRKPYQIAIIIILIILYIAFKFVFAPKRPEEVKVVEIHEAQKGDLNLTTTLIGKVEAKNYFTAKSGSAEMDFGSPPANLAYIAEAGTWLKKGELIAHLDAPETKAQYETALESAKIARKRHEREKKLLKAGASSRHSVEQKYIELANAESSLARAKSSYDSSYFEAPFDGIVGSSSYSAGSAVESGSEIVNFFDPNKLVMKFDIPAGIAAKLEAKTTIIFNNHEFETSPIQKALSSNSYTVPAHAEIECKNCMIGQSHYFDLQIMKKEDVLIIPDSCIFIHNGKRSVYKVKDDRAELEMVEVGDKANDKIIVLEGIEAGDIIISTGQARLYPGIKVKIFEKGK